MTSHDVPLYTGVQNFWEKSDKAFPDRKSAKSSRPETHMEEVESRNPRAKPRKSIHTISRPDAREPSDAHGGSDVDEIQHRRARSEPGHAIQR